MKKVLVLCTGNSCRSQIAEGYLRKFAEGTAEIFSAGIETHGVNPKAIATMKEDGIDISNQTSNNFDEYNNIDFDFVITVCDNAKNTALSSLQMLKNFITTFQILPNLLELNQKF